MPTAEGPALARRLVALRRKTGGRCAVCLTEWSEGYPSRKYCSGRCRMRASYRRRRQQGPGGGVRKDWVMASDEYHKFMETYGRSGLFEPSQLERVVAAECASRASEALQGLHFLLGAHMASERDSGAKGESLTVATLRQVIGVLKRAHGAMVSESQPKQPFFLGQGTPESEGES